MAVMAGSSQRDQGREGPLLPRRRSDHEPEQLLVTATSEPVSSGRLLVADAARQLVHGGDVVVDDRSVGHRGADQAPVILLEEVEEDLEIALGEEGGPFDRGAAAPGWARGRHHHECTSSAAKRSMSWTRVALRRRATATRTRG